MLTSADYAVLSEAYRESRAARDKIHTIIGKVYDEDLALDLNHQALRFMAFENRVIRAMEEDGEKPKKEKAGERMRDVVETQASTIWNTSTEHLADVMIRSNAQAITDMLRTVKRNQGAKREYCELAEELMDFEEKNIEKMKSYLRN